MDALEIRKIPFDFEGVEFVWNPGNPRYSIDMNKTSFLAIGLERYFCRAMRDAEPLIRDAETLALARAFREQEGVHSLAHRRHVNALCERYPGLRGVLERLIRHYDDLYEARSLEYHLAYSGGLESIFTPTFKLFMDHREVFFGQGDARVSSLFLWHFCEEVEHRSAALDVYNHVVGSYWFRVRNFPSFLLHVGRGLELITAGFREHVTDVPEEFYKMPAQQGVPRRAAFNALLGVLGSQMPWHHPSAQSLPEYFHEWMLRYQRGEDMTRVYGVPVEKGV